MEESHNNPQEIGAVKKEDLAKALHHESALPTLRTYQGDIAEFIREKDQSAITIATKQREEEQRQEKEEFVQKEKVKDVVENKIPRSAMLLVLSIFLVIGAVVVGAYAWLGRENQAPLPVAVSNSLIKADEQTIVESSGLTPDAFKESVLAAKGKTKEARITEFKLTNSEEKRDVALPEVIAKLNLHVPAALARSLAQDYMLGVYGGDKGGSLFFIFRENDYGIAFRDMLEWEKTLYSDFAALLPDDPSSNPSANASFVDYIISNKDTRAVLSGFSNTKLLYTFLDKNTILITESAGSLRGLVDAYSTRNLVR